MLGAFDMAIKPVNFQSIKSFSISCGLVLTGVMLSACSSSNSDLPEQSLISVWSQEGDLQKKEAARVNAINKVRQSAQHEANNIASQQNWTTDNDNAYLQAIKQTDIVFDEQSSSFISSSSEQSSREKYLYEQALKNQDARQDILYKEAVQESSSENSSSEPPSTN